MNSEPRTTHHVQRAAGGDPDSMAWVVERFSPLLLAQAEYRIGTALARYVDAADLVQDVWVRALPHVPQLTPRDGRLTPVLVSFLSTTLLRRLRDLAVRSVRDHAAAVPTDIAVDRTGVVTRAMRAEDCGELYRQLAALEPEDRAVLVLRGIEQRSNAEAASILGMKPNTAAVRFRRAMDRLRDRWPLAVESD